MQKYEILKTAFKIFQFIIFCVFLLHMILKNRGAHSMNAWIIVGYLVSISIIILVSIFVHRLYTWFPYLQVGYKLAITVMLMSAFAFDESATTLRSILTFILLGVSIIFLIISLFFNKEDRINDIVMTREFEQQVKSSMTAGSQVKKYNIEEAGIKDEKEEESKKEVVVNTSMNNKTKSYLF